MHRIVLLSAAALIALATEAWRAARAARAAACEALGWLDDYEPSDTLAAPLEGTQPW